jgi:hypothetical protein
MHSLIGRRSDAGHWMLDTYLPTGMIKDRFARHPEPQ